MSLSRRRSSTFVLFFLFVPAAAAFAQTVPSGSADSPPKPAVTSAPSAGDLMRERINKAKAYLAVRNYNAAIFELENIRRETADPSVQSVTSVLLMNSYLEKGDYKKAQDLLTNYFNHQKTTRPDALVAYAAVAGQIAKFARNQADRYRAYGVAIGDRNLPIEVIADLEKIRELLEVVIAQARQISPETGKANTAFGLLEEATASRAAIARDDYDAKRWREAVADWREQLASSRSVVVNAIDGSTEMPISGNPAQTTIQRADPALVGAELKTTESAAAKPPKIEQVIDQPGRASGQTSPATSNAGRPRSDSKSDPPPTNDDKPPTLPARTLASSESNKVAAQTAIDRPVSVGSLMPYATRQMQPSYPPTARSARATGVVRVEVLIDETGEVAEIRNVSGPSLLQESAKDAIRRWKFRPMVVNGQAVKVLGYISFNFSL
ncbi:MAG: hypothetical protein C4324_02640 [Blastocatellia bacterium]